jgi:hypothetical protein
MSLTTEGVLIAIGAVFLLIGVLGGGVEISAIKVPAAGKLQRLILFGVGGTLIILGVIVSQQNQPTSENQNTLQAGTDSQSERAIADGASANPEANRPKQASDDDTADNE